MKLRTIAAAACLTFGLGAAPAFATDPTVPGVDETFEAAPGMFEPGTFPPLTEIDGLFIHEFNAEEPEVNPTVNKHTVEIGSVINYFTQSHPDRPASAQFGVQGGRSVQFMDVYRDMFGDTAYAQGYSNYEAVSIETYGAQDEETKQEVARLIYELEVKKGGEFTLMTHDMVMPTLCGDDVDLQDYANRVNQLHAQGGEK